MKERGIRHFDWLLLATTLLLLVYGVAMVYSATIASGEASQPLWDTFFGRQIIYAIIGLGLMFLTTRFDYRYLEILSRPLYALMLITLVLVLFIGQTTFGAQRWLNLGLLPLQPSEFAKIFIIVALAKYLADQKEAIDRLPRFFLSLIYVLVPMVLVYLQPDLGTALLFGGIWLAMVLVSGVRLRNVGLLFLIALLATPLLWLSMQDYMRERVIVFFNPSANPLGTGYNITQARIAVGSGGLLGRGFASGSQSQLHFLRVRHTDYVFSVLAEEFGFVGVVILLVLLLIVILRLLRAADLARDSFGRLFATGFAATFALQCITNIGMNIGLIPAAGTPLPFISYGGSGLITFLLAEGLVQSILIRHRKLELE